MQHYLNLNLSPDQVVTIALWIIGGFLGVLLVILIHIGNSGRDIKITLAEHGERISHVESEQKSVSAANVRIESKLDRLIERK